MNKIFKKTSLTLVIGTVLSSIATVKPNMLVGQATAETNKNMEITLPFIFSNDLDKTTITSLPKTKKIIVDYYNVPEGLAKDVNIENNPLIENINIKKFGDRLRVILDTKMPVKYELLNNGKQSKLHMIAANDFEEMKPMTVKQEKIETRYTKIEKANTNDNQSLVNKIAETKAVENKPSEKIIESSKDFINEIQGINIKKGENNSVKVLIDINSKNYNPVFTKDNNNLFLDLKGVAVPLEFQKNIEAKGLGGLLKYLEIGTQKGNARLVFKSLDNWDYSSYQLDNKLVVEIKKLDIKNNEKTFNGKTLSLNFQNMDIRAILQVIADFTDLNIMASDSVQGSMSLRLKNVPWDQALSLVLEAKNLSQVKDGNVIWIATAQEISDKNKASIELKNQTTELAPLKVQFFQLNYYSAKDLKDILEGRLPGAGGGSASTSSAGGKGVDKMLLSARGNIGVDVRNNTLFIQDTEERLKNIETVIKRLDIPTKQVLIEAKMVVATDDFSRQLGSQFGFGRTAVAGNNVIGVGSTQGQSQLQTGAVSPTSATVNSVGNIPLSNSWSSPVAGGGSFGLTILNAVTGNFLSAEISALESKNLGKVVSSPKLLLEDNEKGQVSQGKDVPYVLPGTSTSPPTVNFKKAELKLEVTPQISPNGRITMKLNMSKDTIGQWVALPGGGSIPSIDTRNMQTKVTVNDGQTVVLGGIYEVTSSDDVSKVPLLGDIPWVGNLFKNTSKNNQKVELIMFITPKLITETDLDVIDAQNKSDEINLTKSVVESSKQK